MRVLRSDVVALHDHDLATTFKNINDLVIFRVSRRNSSVSREREVTALKEHVLWPKLTHSLGDSDEVVDTFDVWSWLSSIFEK